MCKDGIYGLSTIFCNFSSSDSILTFFFLLEENFESLIFIFLN